MSLASCDDNLTVTGGFLQDKHDSYRCRISIDVESKEYI